MSLLTRPRGPDDGTWHALPDRVASQLAGIADTLPTRQGLARSVALISPGRGSGTSTCTVNLARALAAQHGAVLLVDANSRSPSLHTLLQVGAGPGVAEVMRGEVPLTTAIQTTSIPRVSVVVAGRPTDESAPSSGTAAEFRTRVLDPAAGFEFVLVDCPAVNEFEDAAGTAAQCDGVILVLHAGRTLRQEAQAAKRLLVRANAHVLGLFLNRRKFYVPQFIYDWL